MLTSTSDSPRARKRAQERADLTAMGEALRRNPALLPRTPEGLPDLSSAVVRLLQVRVGSGRDLDWAALAASSDADLEHDLNGLFRDYRTFGSSGRLPEGFVPRCERTSS